MVMEVSVTSVVKRGALPIAWAEGTEKRDVINYLLISTYQHSIATHRDDLNILDDSLVQTGLRSVPYSRITARGDLQKR